MASSSSQAADASPATLRRLMKEYKTEQQSNKAGSSPQGGSNSDNNILDLAPRLDSDGEPQLLSWRATLRGPPSGAYAGGLFDVVINVPPTYPTRPPTMHFTTRIWHPNVSWKTGEICLDVLTPAQWSPAWTLSSACLAVVALLDAPEPDSPLNVDAANVLRTGDMRAYRSMCRMHTLLWAGEAGAIASQRVAE